MALTVSYSFHQTLSIALETHNGDQNDIASNSDIVALAGGGFATVADNSSGLSDMTVYDAAGGVAGSPGQLALSDSKIAQDVAGHIWVTGNHAGGGIDFQEFTAAGALIVAGTVSSDARDSNADIAALADDGLAFVSQRAINATNHDIEVSVFSPFFEHAVSFTVDTSTANDQNPTVAALVGGGYAVAWERIDASGHSSAWLAVYNDGGSVRSAPRAFDGFGNINHKLAITTLASGGFSVGYQDDLSRLDGVPGHSDITVVTFNAQGNVVKGETASTLASDDSEAAISGLSNGLVLSTFTNVFDAGHGPDTQVLGSLIDPVTGAVLTGAANPLVLDAGDDQNSESSVFALPLAHFALSYSTGQTGEVIQRIFQLVRTVTGDVADNAFTGDDAVDIVSGRNGADTLGGGANDDVLSGGASNDLLDGGSGSDKLGGGTNNDYLFGGAGNDTLDGGAGADALLGGDGNDTYFIDNAGDEVHEASSLVSEIDTVRSAVTFALGANLERLSLMGSAAIAGTGNARANMLIGNDAANVLSGLGGDDTVSGNSGDDSVNGVNGADALSGGLGQDDLSGGFNNDTLLGGAGADQLAGGPGADMFVFRNLGDSGIGSGRHDTIVDFLHTQHDRIDLSGIDADTATPAINDAFTFIGAAAFSGAHQLRFDPATHLLSGNVNASLGADFEIYLPNTAALTAPADFIL